MLSWMIATSAGIALVACLPVLPSISVSLLLLFLTVLLFVFAPIFSAYLWPQRSAYLRRWLRVAGCFLIGVLWGCAYGQQLMGSQLPLALVGQTITAEGVVVGLPQQSVAHGQLLQRFDFKLLEPLCVRTNDCSSDTTTLRLSWYAQNKSHPQQLIKPGQRWQLQVSLRRPWGMANPGGFDYQSWLIQRGIGAVGRVHTSSSNQLRSDNRWHIDRLRWQVSAKIDQQPLLHGALIKALLVGDKRAISPGQWVLFAATGTTHLMVISGLHVGLISALVLLCSRYLLMIITGYRASNRWSAMAALLAALLYALAAGFSLPTQRALIMVAVWLAVVFFRRHLSATQGLVTALLGCLLFDPLAPAGLSFWLSFAAVAVIFYGSVGRHQRSKARFKSFTAQYLVFIGLLPVLAITLGQFSWLAPLANSIAIPLFSILIVPFNLVVGLLAVVSNSAAMHLWQQIDFLLDSCLRYLQWLTDTAGGSLVYLAGQPPIVKLLAIAAVLVVLLPKGFPLRWAGIVLLIPLFFLPSPRPAAGDVWLTVLDVGQGLSIVVQTQQQVMVYDVGAQRGEQFSAANTALIPFLRHRGIDTINTLVISHADNDHAGGFATVTEHIAVEQLFYGQQLKHAIAKASPCDNSVAWHRDGVSFNFLYPAKGGVLNSVRSSNNASCVLTITSGPIRFLLPGDIEDEVELMLLNQQAAKLAATVLIAPHHGSHSSSSWPFVKTVAPRYVVFSSGYRNQFSHPRPEIVERYQQLGSVPLVTAASGAITFKVEQGQLLLPSEYRHSNRHYWTRSQ